MFSDGFDVAADVGSGDGIWESFVGDGFDGGFEYRGEKLEGARTVDACVLPELGGDADESGEESAGENGGCMVGGVRGFALDVEGFAVLGLSEGLEPGCQGFVVAVDGVGDV